MKLKFKADAQDVLIFLLFAVFLLYIVCLGVLNFPELAVNGRFYGLNPFPAFESSRLATTLVLYFLFLAGIFASVSSYFFDREKGTGFSKFWRAGQVDRRIKRADFKGGNTGRGWWSVSSISS